MAVNGLHLEYLGAMAGWSRARDVLSGQDAVKSAGTRYLPKLDSQTNEEYEAYKERAAFFNASARTAEGFIGLIFRRPPFIKAPEGTSALGKALDEFRRDADMLGTSFVSYAKDVVEEVIAVGRAGTLVDWEGEVENRAYVTRYAAENILNWRVERINGRNIPTMIVLYENVDQRSEAGDVDEFVAATIEQIRVLKLVPLATLGTPDAPTESAEALRRTGESACVVEIWRPVAEERQASGAAKMGTGPRERKWALVETRVPRRLGRPLPTLPFVFHGAKNSQPSVGKLPLSDIIAVNLDHYRLDADYKHGVHFTALPTAWVSGFGKEAELRIGASIAWTAENPGASAGFLEFTGQGLTTFERAMDRDERLLAILGSRLLEPSKRVGETAEAIELRQSGENSVLGSTGLSVSASLTQVLQWVYWWNSTEETPEDVGEEKVKIELNTDFSTKGLSAQEIQAIVAAWQAGALSRDAMTDLFRRGEVLPEGRTVEEEERLIGAGALPQGDQTRLRVEG